VNYRFLLRLICLGACIAVLATRAQTPPSQNKPAAATPEAFAQYLKVDLDRSAKLLKAANFQPQ